ncbi:putative PAS/PAC sensor protein [Desulforamulus reducens MI-1]|uniref:histidine kinase n=1 Tax=Desulforamulus reducens (strain ATCC BAA-1160 / DSM 100696 / MI-1) TaxID=349161 RepID=A4J5N4_DESRM|nr:PAS domain S-box protein [Desulforamulus reducens]ABO50387.1 putative PAS/PAC sensor protein [Desulforamulus reducens MI-1]
MTINKKLLNVFVLLLAITFLNSVFLFKKFSDTYGQIDKIQSFQKQLTTFDELFLDIDAMATNLQDYIVLRDHKYLENYYRESSYIVKKQTELYNSPTLSKNQDVLQLMELSKSYMSFASLEVIQVLQTNNFSRANTEYLYTRNKELTNEIINKLNSIKKDNDNQISKYFHNTILNIDNKIILLLFILFSSLLLLPYLLYLMFKPSLTKCVYTSELAEYSNDAVMFIDSIGNVKYVNKSAQDLFGLLPENVVSKNVQQFPKLFPRLQNVIQPLFHSLMHQKESLKNKVTFKNDGRSIDLTVDYISINLFNRFIGVMMVSRCASRQNGKPLLLDTLEKERKRISIEIHDWIARYMSTIIHSLDYNLRLHKNGNLKGDQLMHNLNDLRNHCQNAAIEMRGIMNDIHPYLIDKVGLISALESYINTFEKLNNIKVYIFYHDRALKLKKKDEIIIYRIIQEALSNIVKHARASEVDINFTKEHDTLKIEIMDNGGTEGDFVAGKGLWGMKERANLMGGDIVFGFCETGFCVTLSVPILSGGQNDGENQNNAD